MALGKRALTWPLTLVLSQVAIRLYKVVFFGLIRYKHDPKLLALLRSREPVLFGLWHQDFVWTLGYLARFNPRRKTYALASASRDGGIATAVAVAQGFRTPIRGSSAKGGRKALLALRRLLRREPDASLAIVCDGPRPPARHLQPGLVYLAQASGRPIWLVRTSFHRVKVLRRTWAQFSVPKPWSEGVCLADGPIHVSKDLDRAGLEVKRAEIERRLNDLAERADRAVGGPILPRVRPAEART